MEPLRVFSIDYILPSLKPDHGLLLHGAINHTTLVSDRGGNLYVRRIAREDNTILLKSIDDEYQTTGFLDKGGSWRIRSMPEQLEFIKKCQENKLQVITPVCSDRTTMVLPFVPGELYQTYISTQPESMAEVIRNYLKTISQANSIGFIYSDRWGPNTIVDRDKRLWHIDFDIELRGSPAREFEIAQALYYSLYFAKDKEAALLECTNFIHSSDFAIYNLSLVLDFLNGHVAYFRDKKYGGVQTEISRITQVA